MFPPPGQADNTMSLMISQTDVVTWVTDGAPFTEPIVPLIYGGISTGWNSNTTKHLPFHSTVDIIMNISNDSMDTVSQDTPPPLGAGRQTSILNLHLRQYHDC